ncbi:helix-turn-helix domain-containing protein [Ottowia sp.]|uniref:helix-turn-helix domain-containing protein n=1 Tax=Ottowia sp. TaxID=1898956 RepID=UPI002C59CB54|nr:helix-turn-helix domain-containing protein [Ottowia sp.]HOB67544.1 helix-turn-helix domain-containing protein [Ottowia sp.]HPZ57204.1 helix-turn-helix domain-containing protein [Ottowia sp.]HQD46841.1 helix-turn-helix domain-containing protein [Ottowia sp.]
MSERNADTQPEAETAPTPAAAPTSAPPASAGAMLRQLREAAGVDAVLLASAMKVSPQKLDALENDRLDQLPDVTFARGLASAICRAFGADPAPVLERMPASAPGLKAPAQNINQPFRRSGDGPTPMLASNFSRPLLIAIAALVLGAAALWFLPTLPIQLNPPAPADAPVSADTAREAAAPAPAAEPTPAEMPAGAASAEQTSPAPATAAAAAPAADASRPGASAELLQFVAKAETWVTVRDAAGKQLINRALSAGETVGVSGDVPLSVTIGRKDAVDVSVRGEPFNHRALSKTTVSRFQVK